MRAGIKLTAAAVALGTAGPALAQSVPMYCGGIGEGNRQEIEQELTYSLKLEFARPDGAYVANVATEVEAADGTTLVDIVCGGAWLLLGLPDGQYEVTATYQGETQTEVVSVEADSEQELLLTF